MKRIGVLLLFLSSVACSKAVMEHPFITIKQENYIQTKSAAFINNAVSLSDVHSFLDNDMSRNNGFSASDYSIVPYRGDFNDTLLYIVNYNGHGWKLLSADKRTPAILAEGNLGAFVMDSDNIGLMNWLENTSAIIRTIKNSSDDMLSFSKEEIKAHTSAWRKDVMGTRTDPGLPVIGLGHWEIDTVYCFEPYYEIDHLTPQWTQNARYNSCSPLLLNSTDRAPAGCIAVAMANTLYYLHKIYNVPTNMYSNCAISGNIISYTRSFSDSSPSSWALMDTTYNSTSTTLAPEAVLIGYLGDLVGIVYGAEGSWALPSNIVTAFSNLGINCTISSYNDSIAKESFNNNIPVIAIASDYLIPLNFNMHGFVIDGYQKTRLKTTYLYRWVAAQHSSPIPIPEEENYSITTYSDRGITAFKINWGWNSQWGSTPENDGWYALTDDWVVTDNGNQYDYNHNRMIVHGFSINE